MGFWRLYNPDEISLPLITGKYEAEIIIPAVCLAILSAMIMLPVSDRYRAIKGKTRVMWLAAGSIAMGMGIWAMFATSILALKLPFPVSIDITMGLLSIIPAIMASGSCIWLYSTAEPSTLKLHKASLLLALGVGSMYYIGMEAISVPAHLYYMPSLFLLSIATAYTFSMVGLNVKIMIARSPRFSSHLSTVFGSIILGLALSSTLFVALCATYFVIDGTQVATGNRIIASTGLIPGIGGITLLMMLLIYLGSQVDKRLTTMADSLKQSEIRFQRLAETTQTAIFTFDTGGIIYANPALNSITGYNEAEIHKLSLAEIFGEAFAGFAGESLATTHPADTVFKRQLEIRSNAGTPKWLYITFSKLEMDGRKVCLASACDISEQKFAEKSLHHLAYRDQLTQLANRASFIDCLNEHLQGLKDQPDKNSCVMLIDLDNFSHVNDTFGYQLGDELLIEVGKRLQNFASDHDTVARLGGNEFALLFSTIPEGQDIEALTSALQFEISQPYVIGENTIDARSSIGITNLANAHYKTPDLVMNDLSIALHRAKLDINTLWVLYNEEIDVRVKRSRMLQSELKMAIKNRELMLHYQPIVDADNHDLKGFEALARWQRKPGDWVSPGEFIPIAEKSGLIASLEFWALESAITQIDAWNCRYGFSDFYVSVNITAETIYEPRFIEYLSRLLSVHNVKRNQLKLELTERVMVDDFGIILEKLDRIIELGCELMIDDFGTGYSSLAYLHKLPVKVLKIDRSFITALGNDQNSHLLVNSIIALAKSLNLAIIAEGLETLEQSCNLKELGANLLQGYLFSRPVASDEAGKFLENSIGKLPASERQLLLGNPSSPVLVAAKH